MNTSDARVLSEIEARVRKVVLAQLPVKEEELRPETSFGADLMADSLDSVELIMGLEEEFGIEIPDEDVQAISTVREATQYVLSRLTA